MEKIASQLLDKAQEFMDENPGMLNSILVGGGIGGLGGAIFTGKEKEDDENPGRRFKRRLKNALLGATVGAGAGGLLSYGVKNFSEALPQEDQPPMVDAWYSPEARALWAGAGGTAAYYAKQRNAAKKAEAILDHYFTAPGQPGPGKGKGSLEYLKQMFKDPANMHAPNNSVMHNIMTGAGTNIDKAQAQLGRELASLGINTRELAAHANLAGIDAPQSQWLERFMKDPVAFAKGRDLRQGKTVADRVVNMLRRLGIKADGTEVAGSKAQKTDAAIRQFLSSDRGRSLQRFLRRNRYTAGAAAATGLLAPHVLSTAGDVLGSVGGDLMQ